MTNFLRRLFIKNYKDVDNPTVRTKHGYLAAIVGIISNLLLFVFKILIGIITMSISTITDAINNLSDMASCIINIVGFKLAGKPADKEHPYGHERIEYITGMIISFIIIALAIIFGYTSITKIIQNEATNYSIWTFVILGVAILIKLWQSLFYKKIAKLIDSVSLKASSQDSLNDVLSTTVVLIASIIEFATQGNVKIDGWAGIVVALFIVYSGIKMVIETANPLIGITPDNEIVQAITKDILSYEGVLGVHDLICHSYGPTTIFMTIHVEVDYKINVLDSHDLIDNIEREVSLKHHVLLTIHMDPIVTDSPKLNELKNKVNEIIKNNEYKITFHDFRMVEGTTHTNLIFDIVVPHDEKHKTRDILIALQKGIKEINKDYFAVINIDNDYLG